MKKVSHYKQNPQSDQLVNWQEHDLGASLFYSHRSTRYHNFNFPSSLHYHDYYELVIFEAGEIEYLCEEECYRPHEGDILLISPGMFHMSVIRGKETLYKRHVFYLYPDALDAFGCGVLTAFLQKCRKGLTVFSLEQPEKEELLALLLRLDQTLKHFQEDAYKALSIGLVIQIFFLISKGDPESSKRPTPLPENLSAIKKYIDENFCDLSSINEIAAHFFYSREYVSRLFRRHFNTTVCDYIKARRINYCQALIEQGCSISEACYQCGFDNMSTFIRAFRSITNMTPSEYKKTLQQKP